MSIIEKAIKKLGERDEVSKPEVVEPFVESIVEKQEELELLSQNGEPTLAAIPIQDTGSIRSGVQSSHHPNGNSVRQRLKNLEALKALGMIAPHGERSQLSEEFRLIKRPLIMNAFTQGAGAIKNGNLIMVTSALPGEGKTFCAINLAMSITKETDRTVLLVDADVAKPSIPGILGLESNKGLIDVLVNENLSLSDVLIKTDIENLTVLPAGNTHRHATELLASPAMEKLIEDIAQRYPDRLVIFDSPPLQVTSESSVLATHMGQIVMVIEAEQTPQDVVKEALGKIEMCEVIGLVLNKNNSFGGGYYGYGYGNGSDRK